MAINNDTKHRYVAIISTLFIFLIFIVVFALRNTLSQYESVGYVSVFVLALISSASIFIPGPGVAVVCAGPALVGLSPLAVAVIGSVAETIGESTGYLVGRAGRNLGIKSNIYWRVEFWVRRLGWPAIVIAASVPNPLFDLVGLAAGTARLPYKKFVFSVWIGKLIKSGMIAYSCVYGVRTLTRLFGLD